MQLISVMPRHFTNRNMRLFLMYMFINSFLYFSVDNVLELKLVKNGYQNFDIGYMALISLIMFPIVFIYQLTPYKYIEKGKLVKMFHLTFTCLVVGAVYRYISILDMIRNRNEIRSIIARCFSEFTRTGMETSAFYLYAFFNIIVEQSVGNTGLTCLMSLYNLSYTSSATFGIKMLNYMSFEVFVPLTLGFHAFLLFLLYPYAVSIDKKDTKL